MQRGKTSKDRKPRSGRVRVLLAVVTKKWSWAPSSSLFMPRTSSDSEGRRDLGGALDDHRKWARLVGRRHHLGAATLPSIPIPDTKKSSPQCGVYAACQAALLGSLLSAKKKAVFVCHGQRRRFKSVHTDALAFTYSPRSESSNKSHNKDDFRDDRSRW